MRHAFTLSLVVNAAFTAAAWAALVILEGPLLRLFQATGEAADLILLFCRWLAPLFGFLGALFVANAIFNTLGRPHYSTLLNWGRATLGTIPFVHVGSALAGAHGVLAANMLGGIVFGTLAVWLCYHLIGALVAKPEASLPPASEKTSAGAPVEPT
jgi:Na+-driven multidrug efflux pump